MAREIPIALNTRQVRSWLAAKRQIDKLNDPSLESYLTVCQQLAQAGMVKVAAGTLDGYPFQVFANAVAKAAVESVPDAWRMHIKDPSTVFVDVF
jgi:hypothetical protein